jgi:Zn-dependent peptidase ImmA (M78 family)
MNANPITYTTEEIKEKVNALLLDTGLEGVFPVPVERLANMLGYKSYNFVPHNPNTSAISGAVEHETFRIYVNRMDTLSRQLFTVAHERGHIVLHKEQGNKIDYRSSLLSSNSPAEIEANSFAAMLLMPEKEFKEKWKLHNKDLSLVSSYFGVSPSAAEVRAKKLNLR